MPVYQPSYKVVDGSATTGGGDVTGAASSTDNAIALWDGTSGTDIKNSTVIVTAGSLSGLTGLLPDATGTRNLGSTSLHWNQIWGDSLRMGGSQIGSTNERISAQNSLTATASLDNRLAVLYSSTTGNTAQTSGHLKGLVVIANRTITANTTDTLTDLASLELQTTVSNGGQTYTNTNTTYGVSALMIDPLGSSGGGTTSISRYAGIKFIDDTVATGTRKSAINFGSLSGATNNAFISDNNSWTGSYFLNSTSTNPSLISGLLTIGAIGTTGTHSVNGAVAVTTSGTGGIGLRVTGNSSGYGSGVTQYSVLADDFVGSSAITAAYKFYGQIATANAVFTTPVVAGINIPLANKGASHTITRLINYYGTNQTAGVSNSFLADNNSFSGNYFINSTSTNPSVITGPTSIGGTATNDSASAGFVGEHLSQSRLRSSSTALTTTVAANITATALTLTAGDWEVEGMVGFAPAATTSINRLFACISTTSATAPNNDTWAVQDANGQISWIQTFNSEVPGLDIVSGRVKSRVSISSTTTFYLVAYANFTVSTMTAYGSIRARRVR